jgi:hypothetical protein
VLEAQCYLLLLRHYLHWHPLPPLSPLSPLLPLPLLPLLLLARHVVGCKAEACGRPGWSHPYPWPSAAEKGHLSSSPASACTVVLLVCELCGCRLRYTMLCHALLF